MEVLDEIEAVMPAIRRVAHGLVQDRDEGEQLARDCLEHALSRRGQWRGGGKVRDWMFYILLNRYRRHLRKSRPRLVAVGAEDTPPRAGGRGGGLGLTELHGALSRLPPDQRAALLLVSLEGMSFEEASRLLSIPRATLMVRLVRARRLLHGLTGQEAGRERRAR